MQVGLDRINDASIVYEEDDDIVIIFLEVIKVIGIERERERER